MTSTDEEFANPGGRAIGVVYLLYFLTSGVGALLARGLVVSGDAAATANNILAHHARFSASIGVSLLANALYIVVTMLFYGLFRGVNHTAARLAVLFSLTGCIIQILSVVVQAAPLVLLGGGPLASAFTAPQVNAAALLAYSLYALTYRTGLFFFGLFDEFLGFLAYKSAYVPRAIGVLLMVAGVGCLTFAWPVPPRALSVVALAVGAIAEGSLLVWLLAKGNSISLRQRQQRVAEVSA